MKATHYRPEAVVVFHTETGDLVARATNDPRAKMDDDVINISTYRDMGADAPTFSINLTRRQSWHKWIASNDAVSIYMCRPPEVMCQVFLGLVEDCRKKVTISEDSLQRVISITGRGVAKAFIQFDTGVVPEAEVATPTVGWLASTSGIKLGGSDAKMILENIWTYIAEKFVNYKFSNDKSLFNLIGHSFAPRKDLIMMDDTAIINWQGSLWALIKEIAESPFYETYWEMNASLPTLWVRPTPFNKEDWDKLEHIAITDEDVVMDETGRSDLETYTIFSVGAKSLFSSNDPYKTFGTLPLWYKKYGDKYGIRRLHVQSAYTATVDEKGTETCAGIMRKLQTDLFNWNIINNSFFNGTIIVRGSTEYKLGYRLNYSSIEDNSNMEYYITSVKQDFVNFQSWTTELGVTRGCDPTKRFAEPVGKSEEYKGLGLVKYDPSSAKAYIMAGSKKNSSTSSGTGSTIGGGSELAQKVVEGAKSMQSYVTYVTNNFDADAGRMDCSLFTQTVYQKYANIDIGRSTNDQVSKGQEVDRNSLQPADLVFFKNTSNDFTYSTSHVGIYVGDGKFIHNSASHNGLMIIDLEGYINSSSVDIWYGARRIITEKASTGGVYSGKTVKAMFTAYYPFNDSMEGGMYDSRGNLLNPDDNTCAAPKEIPWGTKIQIKGTSRDGQVYTVNDVGGAINVVNDTYHFDLCMHNNEECLNWGVQYGEVIIIDGE